MCQGCVNGVCLYGESYNRLARLAKRFFTLRL